MIVKNNSNRDINNNMIRVLCQQYDGFHVAHFNARSLKGDKLDYVRYVFENSPIDVIAVTETWFESEIPDKYFEISGYNIFRNDRSGRIGGGVAIYIKENLCAKIISKSSENSTVEFINLEIFDCTTKVFLSCVYNPNRTFSLESFFNSLSNLLIVYDFFLICGDMNVNLLVNDSKSLLLQNHIATAGLHVVNLSSPTRFGNNVNPSLLDVILVSDCSSILHYDQLSFVSDHDLIFSTLNIKLKNKKTTPTCIEYRDFRNINYNLLFSDALCLDWSDCFLVSDVNNKLEFFINKINCLYDLHVPLRKKSQNSNSCPWYSHSVIRLKNKKNNLYKKWKNNPTPQRWTLYSQARNVVVFTVRYEKRKYFSNLLNPSLSTKILWKNLRTLNVCPSTKSSCNLDPNILNDYFLSACIQSNVNDSIVSNVTRTPLNTEFSFTQVRNTDVEKILFKIKSNAIGCDNVALKFLKMMVTKACT